MKGATPATIKYNMKSVEVDAKYATAEEAVNMEDTVTRKTSDIIRFHSVIVEDHGASSQITKYPVQTGFEVSDHAIKKNRIIKLEGIVTNTIIEGTQAQVYSSNNSKSVFEIIKLLVNNSMPCEVTTNLGIYTPVVFTNFSTRQKQGMTDAVTLVLSGEELQVKEALNKAGATPITWTKVTGDKRKSIVDSLIDSKTKLPGELDDVDIFVSDVTLGNDFRDNVRLTSGEEYQVVYSNIGVGQNGYVYELNSNNIKVYNPKDGLIDFQQVLTGPLTPSPMDLTGALNGFTNCTLGAGTGIINKEAEKYIDTAMGTLNKSVYGAKQDIINLGGNDATQSFIGATLDCVASSAGKGFGSSDVSSVQDLTNKAINGVKDLGRVGTGTFDDISKQVVQMVKVEPKAILPLAKGSSKGGI